MERLRWIMEVLRSPDKGCPWDLKQDHESLKPYLLEEACEVLDAIEDGDDEELCKELGDLLLQIVFHSEIARQRGSFSLDDVAQRIASKLIRRHPHVFGDGSASTAEEVLQNWESIKMDKEKREHMLDGVPRSLPSLLAAYRIQEKVSSVGFDWKQAREVIPKIHEEIDEFIEAYEKEDFGRSEAELGDLLFSVVNLSRLAGLNSEFALRKSNDEFRRRFSLLEQRVKEDGKSIDTLGLKELDKYWEQVKKE